MEIKPIFGKKFSFPENATVEMDDLVYRVTEKTVAQFVDDYDEYIVSQIAKIARENGISELVILNKKTLLDSLKKQMPQKVEKMVCPSCGRIFLLLHGKRKGADFCDCCGQALDWGNNNG